MLTAAYFFIGIPLAAYVWVLVYRRISYLIYTGFVWEEDVFI